MNKKYYFFIMRKTFYSGVDRTNASKLVGIEVDPYGGSSEHPDFDDEGMY